MEAIILAGGRGTRLQSVVADVPKPMARIGQRPFLELILSRLVKQGFRRIVLSVGYLASSIVAYFGCEFAGVELVYAVEDVPLGTGGGVRMALDRCLEEHVFVFNGDTYLDLEVDRVEARWQAHHKPIIIIRRVPDTARYGRVELRDGYLVGFAEKMASGPGLVNAGCYVLQPELLAQFPLGQHFSFEDDFLPKAIAAGGFDYFVTNGYFVDIGLPEDYARARQELLDA